MTSQSGAGSSSDDPAALAEAVDRLASRISRWTLPSWAITIASGTRADHVHRLVQRLADLEASATGREIRPVPRLSNDLVLPDQLRVVGRDLVAAQATPDLLRAGINAVADTNKTIWHQG